MNNRSIVAKLSSPNDLVNLRSNKKSGRFEEGRDKLNRPYEKKIYDDGTSIKREILKNGKGRITITGNLPY